MPLGSILIRPLSNSMSYGFSLWFLLLYVHIDSQMCKHANRAHSPCAQFSPLSRSSNIHMTMIRRQYSSQGTLHPTTRCLHASIPQPIRAPCCHRFRCHHPDGYSDGPAQETVAAAQRGTPAAARASLGFSQLEASVDILSACPRAAVAYHRLRRRLEAPRCSRARLRR